MSTQQRVAIDPDVGIPDLVRSLTDDSRRLLGDEVRLAKLEMRESVGQAGRGAMWLGLAFGISIVMLVAFTIFLTALIGRLANRHYWVGALVTAAVELGLAVWLFKKGAGSFAGARVTLPATRESLKDTAHWVSHTRDGVSSLPATTTTR